MQWQPIETAPKDGTPLLLYARSRRATASVVVIGWYIEQDGWIECAFTPNAPVGIVPTHWQRIPEPRIYSHFTLVGNDQVDVALLAMQRFVQTETTKPRPDPLTLTAIDLVAQIQNSDDAFCEPKPLC
jgi:hypothetical protein